jgi:hypothetical protein
LVLSTFTLQKNNNREVSVIIAIIHHVTGNRWSVCFTF